MREHTISVAEEDRFFIFQIGDELCGTPLLGVREVIQAQEVKAVPDTKPFFVGMVNIRGQIIGVIDLRLRYGHPPVNSEHKAFVVFDTRKGTVAAIVDRVDSVSSISNSQIDKSKSVMAGISPDYLLGVAHVGSRLVTLLDLNRLLGDETVATRSGC